MGEKKKKYPKVSPLKPVIARIFWRDGYRSACIVESDTRYTTFIPFNLGLFRMIQARTADVEPVPYRYQKAEMASFINAAKKYGYTRAVAEALQLPVSEVVDEEAEQEAVEPR